MATDFEIILPFGIERGLDAAEAGLDEIDRVEEQLTVYRDSSEVSDVNRRAADEEVVVSPELFELLTLAARITNETQSPPSTLPQGRWSRRGGFIDAAGECRPPMNAPPSCSVPECVTFGSTRKIGACAF